MHNDTGMKNKTQEKPKVDLQAMLKDYVKADDGLVYHALQSKKKESICYLRRKNKYIKIGLKTIKQNLVDRKFKEINEHELKNFHKEDNAWAEVFVQKLIKRTVLAQLLIELDDELREDFEDDNRMRAVLAKSTKEVERVANKFYDRMYSAEERISQSVMNSIDSLTTKIGKMTVAELTILETKIIETDEKK